jgi:hypothetical protein
MDVEDSTRNNSGQEGAATFHPGLQKSTLIYNPGFLVLLPGLITLIGWEILAWRWPIVAKLVSRPSDVTQASFMLFGRARSGNTSKRHSPKWQWVI